jgi:hypothetical protein
MLNFRSKVVGVTFLNRDGTSRQSVIQNLTKQLQQDGAVPLQLKREPNNPKDHRAVAVWTLDHQQLGYLSRTDNIEVSTLMDSGGIVKCQTTKIVGGGSRLNYGVVINVWETEPPSDEQITVCPKPPAWARVFEQLVQFAQTRNCVPATPPSPLILSGWWYSSDLDKMERWSQTVDWSKRNQCHHIVNVTDDDYYKVLEADEDPARGPSYLPFCFERKTRPRDSALLQYIAKLSSEWTQIVGEELGHMTKPLHFTGKKGRRLVISADATKIPPWGTWYERTSSWYKIYRTDQDEHERRTFTKFRRAINNAIAPHAVDIIYFEEAQTTL